MGAHTGDARQLHQALDGPVLSVFAVEHRVHHVDPLLHHAVPLKAQKALAPNGRKGNPAVVRMLPPFSAGQIGILPAAVEDPLAPLGNAHGEDVVLIFINVVQHGFGAAQGDLMLRTDAAEQNANTQFFHDFASFSLILSPGALLPPGKYLPRPW